MSLNNFEFHCNCCKKPTLNKCSHCKIVFFCSNVCQIKQWEFHKTFCQSKLVEILSNIWSLKYKVVPGLDLNNKYFLQSRTRIHNKQHVLSEISLFTTHVNPKSKYLKARWRSNKKQLPPLFEIFKSQIKNPSSKQYLYFHQVIKELGFYIPHDETYVLGLAIMFIRHSCQPNAHITPMIDLTNEHLPILKIVALKDIEPNEEITISYHDSCVMGSFDFRRNNLLKYYNFECMCSCCTEQPPFLINNSRKIINDKIELLYNEIKQGVLTIDASIPNDIQILLLELETIAEHVYPSKEYTLNPALINIRLLKIRIQQYYNITDFDLIENVMKDIDLLQSRYSSIYLELKNYFSKLQ